PDLGRAQDAEAERLVEVEAHALDLVLEARLADLFVEELDVRVEAVVEQPIPREVRVEDEPEPDRARLRIEIRPDVVLVLQSRAAGREREASAEAARGRGHRRDGDGEGGREQEPFRMEGAGEPTAGRRNATRWGRTGHEE